MSKEYIDILFPVGRMVWGSTTVPRTTDADGKPLTIKTGPNAGQPTQYFQFGVAIPKGSEQTWAQTEWGAKIYQAGQIGFPAGQYNAPTFAWKVVDGDSTIPNKNGVAPNSREGYPGHWVVAFSSTNPPRTVNANGSQAVDPAQIKAGHFVQVYGSVTGNESTQSPGVFVNHSIVAHSAFGPEIQQTADPASVGFGQGPLPAGASAVPLTTMLPPAAAPQAQAPQAQAPQAQAPSPQMPVAAPAPAAPIVPNHAFAQGPAVPAAPQAPAAPAAPTGPRMTAKAQFTYDQYRGSGWTDEQLRANGLME